jgi:ATPase family associated with various cellular activities (AAA)
MPRHFNIAGPCKPDIHYMLSPLARIPRVMGLIEQQSYFVIHAPRQVGKTTAMMALAQELTANGRYVAVLVSVEGGSALEDNLDGAEQAILCSWQENIEDRLPPELSPPPWIEATPGQAIRAALRGWSRSADRPLVIFIDEIDSLQNQVLISVLRQPILLP